MHDERERGGSVRVGGGVLAESLRRGCGVFRLLVYVCAVVMVLVLVMGGVSCAEDSSNGGELPPRQEDGEGDEGTRGKANLETPQAAMEHFILSARDARFERAAEAMNFRLTPSVDRAVAAEKLFYVINQEMWIDWESLPDRPDGMTDFSLTPGERPMEGEARSNIRLGSITADGREIPVRVQRVTAAGGEKVWKFSANTVENIDVLYADHGPSLLQRKMPEWASQRALWRVAVWKWIVLIGTVIVSLPIGYFVMTGSKKLLERVSYLPSDLLDRFDMVGVFVVSTLVIWVVVEFFLGLPNSVGGVIEPLALAGFVISVTWLFMQAVNMAVGRVGKDAIRRFREEDSEEERRVLTQVTVARHAALLITGVIGVGVLLLQLDYARILGTTLLSSAGVAAVVFGIAGHAILGNLIAGLQIALTQPIRLGDTVYVEENWGTIEEIRYTYVVVNTWDKRRVVFPIRYFTSEHFENWSLNNTFLTKPIYLHVDYTAPVDKIRDRFLEFVHEDELWDSENDEPMVLVTDITDRVMIVRLTCAGKDASDAWYLSCRVREKMLAWLQEFDGGAHLPRHRLNASEYAVEESGRRGDGVERS